MLVHGSSFPFEELSASNVVLLSSGDEARQSEFEAKASTALNETGETFVPVRSVGA